MSCVYREQISVFRSDVSEQVQCLRVSSLSEWRGVFRVQDLWVGIYLHVSAGKSTVTVAFNDPVHFLTAQIKSKAIKNQLAANIFRKLTEMGLYFDRGS